LTDDVPIGLFVGLFLLLLFLSAFFSSTETALMSLNRYRLRHLARSGHRGARLAEALLRQPDRLIGLILLGNNLVNVAAASLVSLATLRLYGEAWLAASGFLLTLVLLIFAEVAPKTLAALHPEKIALPAAFIYYPLLKVTYPIVWTINLVANGVLRLLGLKPPDGDRNALSREELKTVIAEAGAMVPRRHRRMLLGVLDLENTTVDDVMIPRQEIVGVDLDDAWEDNIDLIGDCTFNRVPVFTGDIDTLVGVVQLRKIVPRLANNTLNREALLAATREPYFTPEGTSLNGQLLNFRNTGQRIAFVVDEYGDIQGLVSVEDILKQIVGELSQNGDALGDQVQKEADDSYIVDAGTSVRVLNRMMNWHLPTDGPTTLNGLIIEQLENFPESGQDLTVGDYPIRVLDSRDNVIKTVRVKPPTGASAEVSNFL
jgi:Mg2+/Co2+ transporter CorB